MEHGLIEHLPHISHSNEIPLDFEPHSKISKRAYPKLRSIATPPGNTFSKDDENLHNGIAYGEEQRHSARGRVLSESVDRIPSNDDTTHPQPPNIGKQAKSLQSKILARGNSYSTSDPLNILEPVIRNGLPVHLEPIENPGLKKLPIPDKVIIAKFEKQSSFSGKAERVRSNSAKRTPTHAEIQKQKRKLQAPRIEEESTVFREQLSEMQQSHHRRKERPLYVRMISRAQKRRQFEERKKVINIYYSVNNSIFVFIKRIKYCDSGGRIRRIKEV